MAYKLTMIFQGTTQPSGTTGVARTAGWSESVYNSVLTAGTRASFTDLMTARAKILAPGYSIIGQRYQVVLPTGGSSTGAQRFPGSASGPASDPLADYPGIALFCRTKTAAANIRPTTLRGLCDSWVSGGELSVTTFQRGLLEAYFAELTGWSMLGRNLAAPRLPVFAISETGVVSLTAAAVVTVPGLIRVSSSVDADGIRRSATLKALSQPTASSIATEGWPYGATEGGTVRDQTATLIAMTSTDISRIITRKPGRPLFVFRGRRSKRRR